MRVFLVCHASTAAVRTARFATDEPLDDLGLGQATAARHGVPRIDRAFCAPSLRCRQSAEALGVAATVDSRIDGGDVGSWAGRSLDEVAASDPSGLGEWLADPAYRGHGGESLAELQERVGAWLDARDASSSRAELAVTDATVTRAAVAHALGAGPRAIWRIDLAPLSTALLVGEPGRWNLRALRPSVGDGAEG